MRIRWKDLIASFLAAIGIFIIVQMPESERILGIIFFAAALILFLLPIRGGRGPGDGGQGSDGGGNEKPIDIRSNGHRNL